MNKMRLVDCEAYIDFIDLIGPFELPYKKSGRMTYPTGTYVGYSRGVWPKGMAHALLLRFGPVGKRDPIYVEISVLARGAPSISFGTSHDVQEKIQRSAIQISRHDKNKDKK